MAVNQRTPTIPAVWANNAQTNIPSPPVKGIGYRNTGLSPSAFTPGQLYGSIGDSATWNQYLYQLTGVAQQQETFGIAPYCPYTNYQQFSIALWTTGVLYQAILDPPVGTPCTNKSYWEEYTPSTVIPVPPISAEAGLTLYVDYSKTTSGDGLSAATAFKNFTDCFTTMRTKFASANGIFSSYQWVPLFKIVATGAGSVVTVEAGTWRLQNINLEIQFNKQFAMPYTDIYTAGAVLRFAGTGSFTCRHVSLDSSTVTWSANCTVNNTGGTASGDARGATVRNCNVVIDKYVSVMFKGTSGIDGVGMFMDVFGTLNSRSTSSAALGQFSVCDIFVGGTLSVDTDNYVPSGTGCSFYQCCIRSSGIMQVRMPAIYGGFASINVLKVGGWTGAPDFGILVNGGTVKVSGTIEAVAQAPTTKGVVTVGGAIEGGRPESSWPGTNPWAKWGNGFYQA